MRSLLEAKYRKNVRLDTPAAWAMSSTVVCSKPRLTNRSTAASQMALRTTSIFRSWSVGTGAGVRVLLQAGGRELTIDAERPYVDGAADLVCRLYRAAVDDGQRLPLPARVELPAHRLAVHLAGDRARALFADARPAQVSLFQGERAGLLADVAGNVRVDRPLA